MLPVAESPARRAIRAALVLAVCLCGLRTGWGNDIGIDLGSLPRTDALLVLLLTGISIACFVKGYSALIRASTANLIPPSEPSRPVIPLDFDTPEPADTVHDIAYNCVICGRPLTNYQSQRQRVGSTCVKTHGPRYKMVANPVHGEWMRQRSLAERLQVEAQDVADEAHLDNLQLHEKELESWIDYRESEEGMKAHARYQRLNNFIYLPVALATTAGLSYLLGTFYHFT